MASADGSEQGPPRFRILSIDGGGIRGLIPALVLAELERRLSDAAGAEQRIAERFDLLAGTSTGGLLALALTAPDPEAPTRPRLAAGELIRLYEEEGPHIFSRGLVQRIRTLDGWIAPRYSPGELRRALTERLGDARLADALRDLLITAYDMSAREPHFFKRWRARESDERNPSMVDAALATAAAPTYFPSHGLEDRALIDGGVFASNPTVAAISEALKRREEPGDLRPQDLLVVSLGTGIHESGFTQREVSGWGRIGWILPHGGEPPLLGAVLDGQSDAADHWAHMVLNHEPGDPLPALEELGHGPRYFRLQLRLPSPIAMDDASPKGLRALAEAARTLIAEREADLQAIVRQLTRLLDTQRPNGSLDPLRSPP